MKIRPMWLLTVSSEITSSAAISPLLRPIAIDLSTSSSRGVSTSATGVLAGTSGALLR